MTSLTYRLHPVGQVLAGSLAIPPERSAVALRAYDDFLQDCPDELSTVAGVGIAPDGRPAAGVSVCWCGSMDEGEQTLRRLRDALGPVEDTVAPMDYLTLQSAGDTGFPRGQQHYWKSCYLTTLTDEAISIILDFAASKPSAASGIGLQRLHGVAARVDPGATAFPHRRPQHELLILSQWSDPTETERNIAWTRAFFETMRPLATRGVYVNDLGNEGEDRVREAYGDNYGRLAEVKAVYDPTNFFHANQNIRPSR